MGRWRPPAPSSSPYITPEGFAALQDELKDLWLRRRDVVQHWQLPRLKAIAPRTPNTSIVRKNSAAWIDAYVTYKNACPR